MLDTPGDKLMRQIISRRRQRGVEQNESTGNLYELAEEYLDAEHEMQAISPSQDTVLQQKIDEVLQKRFNYNPTATLHQTDDGHSYGETGTRRNLPPVRTSNINKTCQQPRSEQSITDVCAVEDQVEQDLTQETVDSQGRQRIITDFENAALPNGAVIKIDTLSSKAVQVDRDLVDVFHQLGTVRVNWDVIRLWTTDQIVDAIYFNETVLPIVASDAEGEYYHIRNRVALIDKSYALPIIVEGKHACDFMEHFVTCSVKKLKQGMVQYAALVDTKGCVMDMAHIAKYEDCLLLVTNGLQKRNVYDYMTAYQVSCRQMGLDVTLQPQVFSVVVSIQGPKSAEMLQSVVSKQNTTVSSTGNRSVGLSCQLEKKGIDLNCMLEIPSTLPAFMHCFEGTVTYSTTDEEGIESRKTEKIRCSRISDVGEDGFEVVVSSEAAIPLLRMLLEQPEVAAAGFDAYDSARMEAGIIRSDVDLPTESSPIQAAVAWCMDTNKLRAGSLFGRQHVVSQLVNGVAKVRVGLVTNERVDANCYILNADTRRPIGFVTSCSWSYGLQMYLSQAYVNTENARHDMPVCISLPLKPDAPVTKREYRRYYRNKTRRTFVRGTVVRLPFVLHNYPIKESEKLFVGGRNVPLQSAVKLVKREKNGDDQAKQGVLPKGVTDEDTMTTPTNDGVPIQETGSDSDTPSRREEKMPVKTRKQLWKEVVAKQRSKNAKTLEMAIKQLEEASVNARVDAMQSHETEGKESPLHIERINIAPRAEIPLDKVLRYYKELHSTPVPSRHRRYRPPMAAR
ncbi:aminomethyltransferase, putative [Babesia caballi]|uniref:Aminomethyltransferase, putative n=1 Tax=Babesia caballi TaxID=5871 RepID=A0AAV4LUW6_BABCB|nr:aminomethyltransferase, putative [Babesia caballi]